MMLLAKRAIKHMCFNIKDKIITLLYLDISY